MNRNRFTLSTLAAYSGTVALAFGLLFSAQSCSEKIDEGNFAIAKEQTINDYLGTSKEFSQIKAVFDRVRLGNKSNASTLAAVLSARGNYTVFAPTNEAMAAYVTKVLGESESIADLTDEQAQLIAYSCVIDNGNESAYDSPGFPMEGGAFAKGDLNDRSITCKFDSLKNYYLINGTSRVEKTDTKLSNGYVHAVSSVIAPSNQSVSGLIEGTANMRIMATLLQATGWADKLNESTDREYEKVERETDPHRIAGVEGLFPTAGHRYLGFTGFVETDDVFQKEWGVPAPVYDEKTQTVTNAQAILEAIKSHCENVYGTLAQNDLKDEDNAVNQFVAYHFMKGRVAHNQFVQHFNEWGYKYGNDAKSPQQNKYSIDISDYFVSVGKYRNLIKVTQDAASHDIFLNRVAEYNVNDNYKFVRVKEDKEEAKGIKVYANNDFEGKVLDNNARNGYFFPIKKIMLMDASTRELLGSERIRFDICTILPEILSNGCRSSRQYMNFPRGYFENITQESESTKLLYLHSGAVGGKGWRDYEGDELMVLGLYDFVLKLPPVPCKGQYEIRMGISNNELRGMCQIYFGDSPVNLSPAGLPVDMRLNSNEENSENIGWVADNKDADITAENDKSMRNHGYMKAPKAFTVCDGKGETNLRDNKAVLRRIIISAYMNPNKTYYLRFKSALNKTDAQFFSDYFEFVPKSVYNGLVAEDIW